MIQIDGRVKIDPEIEMKHRDPDAPAPDFDAVYILKDTDGTQAIVSEFKDGREIGLRWIVKYESLVEAPGTVLCDQQGCGKPAVWTCIWTRNQNYCDEHMKQIEAVGRVLGHDVPTLSKRRLI